MRSLRRVALTAALVLAVSSCAGAEGSSGVATLDETSADGGAADAAGTADPEELALQFAECMRDNGMPDFPDPTVDEDGNVQLGRAGDGPQGDGDFGTRDREETRSARQACSELSEGLRPDFSTEERSEMQDALVEFAACVRENGYDMPDPQLGEGGGGAGGGGGGGAFGDIDRDDPAFQAAQEACQDLLAQLPRGRGR